MHLLFGRPAFLIIATDGFWDLIFSQQAVEPVGKSSHWKTTDSVDNASSPSYEPFSFNQLREGLSARFEESMTMVHNDNVSFLLLRNRAC